MQWLFADFYWPSFQLFLQMQRGFHHWWSHATLEELDFQCSGLTLHWPDWRLQGRSVHCCPWCRKSCLQNASIWEKASILFERKHLFTHKIVHWLHPKMDKLLPEMLLVIAKKTFFKRSSFTWCGKSKDFCNKCFCGKNNIQSFKLAANWKSSFPQIQSIVERMMIFCVKSNFIKTGRQEIFR